MSNCENLKEQELMVEAALLSSEKRPVTTAAGATHTLPLIRFNTLSSWLSCMFWSINPWLMSIYTNVIYKHIFHHHHHPPPSLASARVKKLRRKTRQTIMTNITSELPLLLAEGNYPASCEWAGENEWVSEWGWQHSASLTVSFLHISIQLEQLGWRDKENEPSSNTK